MDEQSKITLMAVLDEITALLCYQSEVPQKHKQDLLDAVERFRTALTADKLRGGR